VGTKAQLHLLNETFETAQPPNPLFCHQEFLEKLAEHGRDAIGRRAAFLLQRLAVDAQRLHYKSTKGLNRGWRRSRLGGGQGSHFYAWWAPKNALPLKESGEFSGVPEDALFLRDIRHHDDHSLLTPHGFETHYMPVTVRDLRREEYTPLPFTQPQVRFAAARQTVRLLKGHPGSGKTTALLHAVDSCGAQRILYVTYSRNLAALARGYFDRFCSAEKHFQVVTLSGLVRQVLGTEAASLTEPEAKRAFLRDLSAYSRTLGPWTNIQAALYDELYAHYVGDALPVAIGRFAACKQPAVAEKTYRERRTRYLGIAAVNAALEAAARLEKLDPGSLAERYFPELALAWRAVERLRNPANVEPSLLAADCVAVDECQDLTPIEALLIVELNAAINRQRRVHAPLLLSGDEAQTVRPTDFEWGWLSDLLHSQLGTPSEFKLAANLRSPRRIAELGQRVWNLYSHLQKQERPSGSGQTEIEDDATDQILYCTANPGPDLNELLVTLAATEGLALISFEETAPSFVPEAARTAVLTVSEAKGLDFNSVCVLDAGHHLERIVKSNERQRSESDVEWLKKRLAIDQLRVALSRPSERLIWLDVNPTDQVVRQSTDFLNGGEDGVASCMPAALLKSLAEDDLDIEERVQRCQTDARQYLDVKPEMAWSRAQQATTLLGRAGSLAAVTDPAARQSAFLTLAEVCFILGLRNTRLPAELGKPDLFNEAHRAALSARRYGLAGLLDAIGRLHRATHEQRLNALVELARTLPLQKDQIEPWLRLEITAKSQAWAEELEAAVFNGHNAEILVKLLPAFYEALDLPDRDARKQRLMKRAIQLLVKDKQFAGALAVLRELPERQPAMEATCHEGLNDFRRAAECHQLAGNLKEALQCYRSIPDFEAALKLVGEMGDHPAGDSLRWIAELQQVVSKRPDKFTKMVTPAEKKLLEEILERSLGVTRRKAAPKKAAKKKVAAAPRKNRSTSNPYF
jgi:hypothetical protein